MAGISNEALNAAGLGESTPQRLRYFQASDTERANMIESLELDMAELGSKVVRSRSRLSHDRLAKSKKKKNFYKLIHGGDAGVRSFQIPVEVVTSLSAQSLGQFGPTLAASAVSGGAAPIVAGMGSAKLEYNSDIIASLIDSVADLSDPETIKEIFQVLLERLKNSSAC